MAGERQYKIGGGNERGTPPMPGWKVRADLRVYRKRLDVVGLVEFKWDWYWDMLLKVLSAKRAGRWGTFPGIRRGRSRPVWGGQMMFWKRDLFTIRDKRARILHDGEAGISEDRRIRAGLLEEDATGRLFWALFTHNVVGGDRKGDGRRRVEILEEDIDALDRMLTDLRKTGHPIWGQLDANIGRGSMAYAEFMRMLGRHGAKVHGPHGIEYTFTIPGDTTKIRVHDVWEIPTSDLHTDHEVRCLTISLVDA